MRVALGVFIIADGVAVGSLDSRVPTVTPFTVLRLQEQFSHSGVV